MSIQPPVLPNHVANIATLTKQHVEEARDHNEVVKVKKKDAAKPDFTGIEVPNFSSIPGHISHGKAKEKDEDEDSEAEKLDPAVVLYLPAASIKAPAGASCGSCWKYLGEKTGRGKCVEVEGGISATTGVCGLYINGNVFEGASPQLPGPIVRISKTLAGYSETGPTHCGTCEYYGGDQGSGPCAKVRGVVEFGGCCNRWQRK